MTYSVKQIGLLLNNILNSGFILMKQVINYVIN